MSSVPEKISSDTDLPILPIDWVWSNVGECSILVTDGVHKTPTYLEEGIPFISVNNITDDGKLTFEGCKFISTTDHFEFTKRCRPEQKDILLSKVGTVGRVTVIETKDEFSLFVNAALIKPIFREQLSYYIAWAIRSGFFSKQYSRFIGGTSQPYIGIKSITNLPLPLPPLNEQKRIVAKIEALQTRTQRVKEALEAIPQLLDQFRQSVLTAAFRGDLTADWRENNPDVDWVNTTLQNVIKSKPRNGYSPKAVDYPTSVKSLTLTATTSGKFKPEFFKYIDEYIDEESYLWLEPKDILIQRSNTIEYVGTSAIYTGDFKEFVYPDLMMKIQVLEEKTTAEFITYALSNIKNCGYFKSNATGTAGNMPKINQKVVMNTPIYLPSIEEQKEIVEQIETFFKIADTIEQQYQELKPQLDQLNQSILAKAFRGELVPQDPNDEPASVLLERIRTEREKLQQQTKAAKKSKTKTTKTRSKKKSQQPQTPIQLELPGMEQGAGSGEKK
ncbi:MAG: restriction endonuclease subunit S [Cyanobacteria bacterium J06639_18]